MNHTVSKIKVYATKDYRMFRSIDGNRSLNKTKISRIIKEINEGNDILDEVPILVKESGNKLDVLDGQHRLDIAQKLGRPVHYIIHDQNMNLYAVAKVNSNTEKWTSADFINCYIKAGNNNYIQLEKFRKKYGISVSTCLTMLTYGSQKVDGSGGSSLQQAFQQGSFEVKKLKEATQLAEICNSFSRFSGWNSRAFIVAISRIIQADKCDFELLLKKFHDDPNMLQQQSNYKGYITNLESIYNKWNSKRKLLV